MLEIRKEYLPMSRPAIGGEEIEAVAASMRSGRIASGPRAAGLHFPPCRLPGFARERYGAREGDLPRRERAGSRILSLPLFPGMAEADAADVRAAVRELVAEA